MEKISEKSAESEGNLANNPELCSSPVWSGIDTARLLSAGRICPDPHWSIATHAHNFWEFIYFVKGSGRVDLPNRTIRPLQYHLVIYPPGLPHAEIANPADPEETIFFSVDVTGNPPAGAHILLPDPHGELRWLCEHVLDEFQTRGRTPLADSYARTFLHLIERAWENAVSIKHDMVDHVMQYMHSNYGQDISLRTLADMVHASQTYFTYRFTSRVGTSPMKYLRMVRIEAAKRLLVTTEMQISEVSMCTGYDDPLYFSRVFRRTTGYSPSEFRRQQTA